MDGYLYSQNIKVRYAKQLTDFPTVTATEKEFLSNKTNHRYYTYYYLTYKFSYMGNNDSASGWPSASNLDYADPNSRLNKQIFSLFKGAKTNTTYQKAVTYIANAFAIEDRDFVDGDSFDDMRYLDKFHGLDIRDLSFFTKIIPSHCLIQ